MKTKSARLAALFVSLCLVAGLPPLLAGEQLSDAAIKQKLLGYWKSPRHAYQYKSDGVQYMLGGTSKSRWDVKDGLYYEEGAPGKVEPYDIVTLTDKVFIYRPHGSAERPYTLQRINKAEATKY